MMKRVLTLVILGSVGSCNGHDDVITEKSPFVEIIVPTPKDGATGVVERSKSVAAANGMRFQYSVEHFYDGEYSVRLLRRDLNIAAENVLRGESSIVRAYSRSEPTSDQRKIVSDYLCSVMRRGCKPIGVMGST